MKKVLVLVLCILFVVVMASEASGEHAQASLYIENYREYKNYIKENAVPQQFVSFQKINFEKELSFALFRLSDFSGEYSHYDYSFCMRNGEIIQLGVNHAGHYVTAFSGMPIIDRPESMEDMRNLPINELARIYIDDIEYVYLFDQNKQPALSSVTFFVDEIQFLWTFSSVKEWPERGNTFIERLLHASTATQARDEFAAAIRSEKPSQLGWKILFFGTPVVVVGGVVAFFVIRKKKAKAKANT